MGDRNERAEREAWAVDFFREHAGYSYRPGEETPEQARTRCAIALAEAEARGRDLGWWVTTETDPDVMDDDAGSRELVASGAAVNLTVILWGPPDDEDREALDDALPVLLGSLGSVVVESETDPYIRVVGAELASEALASHADAYAETREQTDWTVRVDLDGAVIVTWPHGDREDPGGRDAAIMHRDSVRARSLLDDLGAIKDGAR